MILAESMCIRNIIDRYLGCLRAGASAESSDALQTLVSRKIARIKEDLTERIRYALVCA